MSRDAADGTEASNLGAAPPRVDRPGALEASVGDLGLFGKAWAVGVFAFCVARAVVIWPLLTRYGVNPWWFLAIDVGTAPTYGLGQAVGLKVLRDDRRPVSDALPWLALLLASFVAPYTYLLASAGSLPRYVVVGVVAWIVLFGVIGGRRLARDARHGRRAR